MSLTSHQKSHLSFFLLALIAILFSKNWLVANGQATQPSRRAIVVDERLSVLRSAPGFTAPHLRRLSKGRKVVIVGSRFVAGFHFHRVAVTRRTRGWIQREALIVPSQRGEDERLLSLVRAAAGFDRLVRARIFLDVFPRSSLRPIVLLLFGDEANDAARKLSRDAARRLALDATSNTGASLSSYYFNFNGLDRYRRQGIGFDFEVATREFQYDGVAWRELLRRFPHSREAAELRRRQALGRRQ